MKKAFIRFMAAACAVVAVASTSVSVSAKTEGLGPWGDIDGYYTWQINGKGWTVYSQNGYSWVYDDYGHRTYLDAYGNRLAPLPLRRRRSRSTLLPITQP